MQWFREWEAFVKGKDNGESSRAGHRRAGALGCGPPGSGCVPESALAQQVFGATP